MPNPNPPTYGYGAEQLISVGGNKTAAIGAASSPAQIDATNGRLCRIVVTTTGTAALSFYDGINTSGILIAVVPASAAAGTVIDAQMPYATGLYCGGGASTPAVTISYL